MFPQCVRKHFGVKVPQQCFLVSRNWSWPLIRPSKYEVCMGGGQKWGFVQGGRK